MNEIVPTAASVANIYDLRAFLDWLHEAWRRDPEMGHGIDDQIRQRVLELCAEGHPDAALLAREVLVTSAWDDCAAWSA